MTICPDRHQDRVREGSEPSNQIAFKLAEHVRLSHGPDGAAVLDIRHGQMFRVNFVGSRILEFLKQELGEPEIAEVLAGEFGIDLALAQADVREFLESLASHHLLSPQAN